ncbi:hypothetical protein EDB86DRAFT_2815812 [Lactarius hatsudake]|nr:hypothetical protein EDB86DRAFT_2815812 [Lactarius hatsudake]
MVGHSGKYGCRLYCDMPSRCRYGDGHYYPVMSCPLGDYDVPGCCHADISNADLQMYRDDLPLKYNVNMRYLLASRTHADYRQRRLDFGICK